jgi:hypothetical protein
MDTPASATEARFEIAQRARALTHGHTRGRCDRTELAHRPGMRPQKFTVSNRTIAIA